MAAIALHRDTIRRRVSPGGVPFVKAPGEPIASAEQPPAAAPAGNPLLEERVGETIAVIDRTVASLGGLREGVRACQQEAEALERHIEAGRAERQQVQAHVDDLELALASERLRAAEAERCGGLMDARINDLAAQIERMTLETEQLIQAATRLLSAEAAALRTDGDATRRSCQAA